MKNIVLALMASVSAIGMAGAAAGVLASVSAIGVASAAAEVESATLLSPVETTATSIDTGLADVVVTATRQSTQLQETPVAVTVFSSGDIDAQNIIGSQVYSDVFFSYAAPGGHWVASLTGHNLADRRYYQSLSYAGSRNSWEGPVSPPRTVFFKIGYTL